MATIRQYARHLRNGDPGRRFIDLYRFRRKDPPTTAARLGLWFIALLLIAGGAAVGWLPGPGGFIAIFGLAIVAMEFRFMALALDKLERVGRDAWDRLRGRRRPARRVAARSAD